jgi:hypothetical protein
MRSLVKLIIAVAVLAFLWKEGIPWWQKNHGSGGSSSSSASTSPGESCVSAAEAAAETWGSGIGKFANPPYDISGWDEFRSKVENQARSAERDCMCGSESCNAAKSSLNDLRSLVNELDGSIRSGMPPPSDLVQRQESIDNGVERARELVKQGK